MKDVHLAVVAGVAVLLLAVTVVLYSGSRAPESEFVSGTPLVQGLEPQSVHQITVKSKDHKVTLKRQADGFIIVEKDGYPASIEKINDLLIKCQEIRCAEKVTDNPDNHGELGVTEKSDDAVSVSFLDAEGKPIIGLIKGKSAEGSMGVYVRLAGQDAAYRSEEHLWLNDRPLDYIDKDLIDVEKKDITRCEIKVGDDSYTIARDDKDEDKIVLQNIPKGKKAKQTAVDDVFGALTNLDLSDVTPADKIDLTSDATYTCHLKNGLSYTVRLAKKDDKHYVRVSAKGPTTERIEIRKDESDAELKKKEAILLAMETAEKFAPRHDPWVYEVYSYDAEKMRKPLGDLLEDKLPDEIAARHILIAYKGAERAGDDVTRSKDEARKLAEEVLEEAKKEGADFAALAKKHSDGPTAEKGGDLGTFGKGKMAEAFDEAAFQLKVDEISDLVETPFGFHIIQRTK
jgi:parvulin-like peptidyl-prolyl isomerase